MKHIRDDLNSGGLADPQAYELAVKQKRPLVTYNIKDFKELATRSQETGVIGISPNLPFHRIAQRLTALLINSSEKVHFGKSTIFTSEASSSMS